MSHISLVTVATEPEPVQTPVLDELTDAAARYFHARAARKLRVGPSPIPQLVAIYALQAARYTVRDWFGEGRDLEALGRELDEVDPRVCLTELGYWRRVFGHVFPRELTLNERFILSQVVVVVSSRIRSHRATHEESARRYAQRENPGRLLQPSGPRRRRRRATTLGQPALVSG